MDIKLTGEWKQLREALMQKKRPFMKAIGQAMKGQAIILQGMIQQGIQSGSPGGKPFLPLAVSTLATRQFRGFSGSKPLIPQTANLVASVVVKPFTRGLKKVVFIGVLRTSDKFNVAEIHEYGKGPFAVPLTQKSRRLLAAIFRKAGMDNGRKGEGGGRDVAIVRIPPRPFIGPVWQAYGMEKVRTAFYEALKQALAVK